jgi:hypothetical protein
MAGRSPVACDARKAPLRRQARAGHWKPRKTVPAAPVHLQSKPIRSVRRVIAVHLQRKAPVSWRGFNFNFSGVVFDGGDFSNAVFAGGLVDFSNAVFARGIVDFSDAEFGGGRVEFSYAVFAGATVDFTGAEFINAVAHVRGATYMSYSLVFFDGAEFSGGTVNFQRARFSEGRVSFRQVKLSGGIIDFSGVGDWSRPPEFDWGSMPPVGVTLPVESEASPS